MRLPVIKREQRYKRHMITFGGLNLRQSFSVGEMKDCSGISHLCFPAITQKQKSEQVFSCTTPTAMLYADKECIASDDGLYYDRKKVGDLSKGKKQLVCVGSKIIVFPDKVYYDTKTKKFASLESVFESKGVSVSFNLNKLSVPQNNFIQEHSVEVCTFPAGAEVITYNVVEVKNNKLSFTGFNLKSIELLEEETILREKCLENQYRRVIAISQSEDKKLYTVTCELVSLNDTLKDAFLEFNEGDVLEITGCTAATDNNKFVTLLSKTGSSLTFEGEPFTQSVENESVVIKRKIPDFSCICSYENRLWGCEGNILYASALGDPTNFFVYNNLSTDSFTVESNTAGDFTACTVYGSYCLFFKENSCYKLYGNRPANFKLTESFGGGILKEDSLSIANVGGKIIYKGNGGIYAFYGGLPQCISNNLEGLTMKNAVSGSDTKRYYITADVNGVREEYVWDIEKGLWSKSGESDALGYSFYGNYLYRLTKNGIEKILEEADTDALWSITFCPFDEDYYKTKNYSRLYIQAQLFENSYICAEVKRDKGLWEKIYSGYGNEKKYINIPFTAHGCHELWLRLSGKGKSIIESVTREFSVN